MLPPHQLRALRIAAGLSQEALARQADCSTAMVRLLEGGYPVRRRSRVLERIAVALGQNDHEPAASEPVEKEGVYAAHPQA